MNRVYAVSNEEVQALERRHRETDDADVRNRCDMILWPNDGLSPPQMAQCVRFSRYTVVRYIQRYEAEGLSGLLTKPRPGRPRRVTPEYEAKLLEAVEQEPRSLALPFSNCPSFLAEQAGQGLHQFGLRPVLWIGNQQAAAWRERATHFLPRTSGAATTEPLAGSQYSVGEFSFS